MSSGVLIQLPSFATAQELGRELERARLDSKPLEEQGGFKRILLNLADTDLAVAAGRVLTVDGYGLVYRRSNSNAAGRLSLEVGGEARHMMPGDWFLGRFKQLTVRNSELGVASGNAELLVLTRPDVLFREDGAAAAAAGSSVGNAAVSIVSQLYNSAAGNQPSDPSVGLPLAGAKGVRVSLDCRVGNTFSTGVGSVVLWYYSPDQAAWCEGRTQLAIPANSLRRVAFDDLQVAVPYGRVYAEVRSGTHSGGAGAIDSYLEVL